MAEKIRIVVIDDEVEVCLLMKEQLEADGAFEVVTSSLPVDAEKIIRLVKPQIILLDIIMPARCGKDIIAALKKDPELKRIPIVVVSGKGEMVYDAKKKKFNWFPNTPLAVKERSKIPLAHGVESFAEAYGVEDYIAKPFSSEILIQVIHDVLSRRRGAGEGDKSSFADLLE